MYIYPCKIILDNFLEFENFYFGMLGFDSAFRDFLICLVLPTIVLQTCGVFSSSWIKHNNTSECYRGIISTRGCPYEVKSNVKCLKKMLFFKNETLLKFDKMS